MGVPEPGTDGSHGSDPFWVPGPVLTPLPGKLGTYLPADEEAEMQTRWDLPVGTQRGGRRVLIQIPKPEPHTALLQAWHPGVQGPERAQFTQHIRMRCSKREVEGQAGT